MRILLLSSLFAYNLFGLEIGDTIRVKAGSHPFYNQIGTVVKIEHGGNTTQAKIDFDGDGVKDGQVIVDYAYTYEVIQDPDPDPDSDSDESSFYMEVSGNGFYIPPTIYVGEPTDSSTVTQDDDGHIVTTPNTGTDNDPNTGTTITDPNDYNGTFTTIIPDYTGLIDQDNDVPMLTSIYERLGELDSDDDHSNLQNIANQITGTRGLLQVERRDIGEQATLADIEFNTRFLNGIRGQIQDGNETRDATLADIVNAINNQGSDVNSSFNPAQDGTNQQTEYTTTFTNLSNSAKKDVNIELGQRPGFMDAPAEFSLKGNSVKLSLLDPASSYGSMYTAKLSSILPSRAEIFLFIKRSILVLIFALYYYFNYKLLFATTDTLIKSNESNTVSNYSIFGINLGGPALKSVKLGIWAIFAASVGFTTIVGLADAGVDFNLDSVGQAMVGSESDDRSIIEIIVSSFVVHLAGIADWAFASVQMFLDVVPVSTLISAVTTYYSNSLLIYGSIFAMNRASRTAS